MIIIIIYDIVRHSYSFDYYSEAYNQLYHFISVRSNIS